MSIDLNWETLTSGPDGEALALQFRDFIHQKFQAVQLPRFIKSVTVHSFEFGTIPPDLELKDITDPLPDFYEENPDADDDDEDSDEGGFERDHGVPDGLRAAQRRRAEEQKRNESHIAAKLHASPQRTHNLQELKSPFLGVSAPGILGATSNLHYFQSHMGSGWSGTQTPLAAVAGASGWLDSSVTATSSFDAQPLDSVTPSHSRNPSQSSISVGDFSPPRSNLDQPLREKSSVSTLPRSASISRPPTRDTTLVGSAIDEDSEEEDQDASGTEHTEEPGGAQKSPSVRYREPRIDDVQAVFRIQYAGDIKLMLTAEILLDYPMPSFVGIPLKLNITGLTFDGVGVLARIRKRVHFCFLSPEDARVAVGHDNEGEDELRGESPERGRNSQVGNGARRGRFGGLLQEVKVESEIGERDGGRQSLKNVGKVERFVLEQVRRIFDEELVYPSFWTFLI
jgi:distribution and morphology protein 12